MTGHELSQALRNGKRVYGTAILSTSPRWPGMIAGAGLDFVFIDTEHVPLDREILSWMCTTYAALGLPAVVRIPEPDPYQATAVLDGGACGIIAPYMETVEQAQALRGAVKLRPLKGKRLAEVLEGKALDADLASYISNRCKNNVLIVNIESVPALEALDDILAVPDVDAIFVGPHDLSTSLGVPEQYNHPRFLEAASTIIAKCRAASVGVGIHYSEGVEQQLAWAREGANFILNGSDASHVSRSLTSDIQRFHKELGGK